MTDLTVTDNDAEIRTIRVTTWLSLTEAEAIDRKRGHYNRASYLRSAGLDQEIARAPDPVNREQWAELGHISGNLAQLVKHLNIAARADGPDRAAASALSQIDDISAMLHGLRACLVGASVTNMKAR